MVHGGFAATILDSAMGCAVHTLLPAGVAYTTLEFKLNFVKPLKVSTGPVRAIGTVLHGGRTTSFAEGRLWPIDGTLFAHATTTCLIFR